MVVCRAPSSRRLDKVVEARKKTESPLLKDIERLVRGEIGCPRSRQIDGFYTLVATQVNILPSHSITCDQSYGLLAGEANQVSLLVVF